MKPKPPEPALDLAKDLQTFEQLPAKTKELDLLQDQAAKASGEESVALHKKIRATAQ